MSTFSTKRISPSALHMAAIRGKADMAFSLQMSANEPKRMVLPIRA